MFSHFRNFIQQCEKKKYLFLPVSGEPMKFNNCFGWIFNKLLNFSLGEKFWNFDICSLKNSWSLLFQSRKGPVECSYAWKLVCSCIRTLLKYNLTIFLTKKIKKSPWHKGCFHIIPDRFLCRYEMLSGIIIIIVIIIIIRVCIHCWQRNPSLDWSHRCLCLANLHHTGPNCLVRSSLHLVFGRPCFLVQNLGVHSVALMVQRL